MTFSSSYGGTWH